MATIDDFRLEYLADHGYTREFPLRAGKREPQEMARELLAARKLIDAYEDRERTNDLNLSVGSKMVATDVLREAKREWKAIRR